MLPWVAAHMLTPNLMVLAIKCTRLHKMCTVLVNLLALYGFEAD